MQSQSDSLRLICSSLPCLIESDPTQNSAYYQSWLSFPRVSLLHVRLGRTEMDEEGLKDKPAMALTDSSTGCTLQPSGALWGRRCPWKSIMTTMRHQRSGLH
ncbi:hypothetical protein DNTS_006446 [Danionella cerebrum]|uniref:Uncharacterized protein n=1 Tax=Danionella cerebrum TaxID=2873325 RepID=A0A553N3X5_9TELE|nr:hypothetical protein DNTS_006446 [Danionella translucida]